MNNVASLSNVLFYVSMREYYYFKNMEDVRIVLRNFTRTTSSHGIPQLGYSRSVKHGIFWLIIFCIGVAVFGTQAAALIKKFLRRDKAVNVELRFEAALFPAVTICNLNPYKNSLVQKVDTIQKTLNIFDHVKKSSKVQATNENIKSKRSVEYESIRYKPIMALCDCNNISEECSPITKPPLGLWALGPAGYKCVCFRDLKLMSIGPCLVEKMWTTTKCHQCNHAGLCLPPNEDSILQKHKEKKCLCPKTKDFCVVSPVIIPVIGDPMWFDTEHTHSTRNIMSTIRTTKKTVTSTSTTTTVPVPSTTESTRKSVNLKDVQDLGYEGMTDEVAIVTKAKENLVFIIAALDLETRVNLSHTKSELIRMCSFNGKQCDIENDFVLHVDPTFGNCYTFNFDPSTNRTSSRAGPMYGLRALVYTNVSDYMPTTEAAGVRIQIHGHKEQPFPDTFGHNAPTGFISSFGIRLKEISRSPLYGDCVEDGLTEQYIYTNRTYSTEGCYRSCFQYLLLEKCGCGDPRFPVPTNSIYCEAANTISRSCLDKITEEIGGFHGILQNCDCRQPCKQSGYSVSFSGARWPGDIFQMGDCESGKADNCVDEYRKNAALLEIYYEQLNYEKLEEREAYGLVNLVADFGGQLGLWLGFSVITCIEIILLLFQLLSLLFGYHADQVLWSRNDEVSTIENVERHLSTRRGDPSMKKSLGSQYSHGIVQVL